MSSSDVMTVCSYAPRFTSLRAAEARRNCSLAECIKLCFFYLSSADNSISWGLIHLVSPFYACRKCCVLRNTCGPERLMNKRNTDVKINSAGKGTKTGSGKLNMTLRPSSWCSVSLHSSGSGVRFSHSGPEKQLEDVRGKARKHFVHEKSSLQFLQKSLHTCHTSYVVLTRRFGTKWE